jgi:hypothetical protein
MRSRTRRFLIKFDEDLIIHHIIKKTITMERTPVFLMFNDNDDKD